MTRNRPGRPSLDPSGAPSVDLRLRLRAVDYDRLDRLARERRASMQDIIRKHLRRLLHDERGGTL